MIEKVRSLFKYLLEDPQEVFDTYLVKDQEVPFIFGLLPTAIILLAVLILAISTVPFIIWLILGAGVCWTAHHWDVEKHLACRKTEEAIAAKKMEEAARKDEEAIRKDEESRRKAEDAFPFRGPRIGD